MPLINYDARKVLLTQLHNILPFVMAALRNRAGHYIFVLWFLLSFFLMICTQKKRKIGAYG